MALSRTARREILDSVRNGEDSFADLGRHFGVSREYIRQLAAAEGITGNALRKTKRNNALNIEAEDLIEDREMYIPPRWGDRVYTRAQFEAWLGENDHALLKRWKDAQSLPLSRSGHANPETQRCTDCLLWKFWNEFYSDMSRVYGKSSRCQECAKEQARATYAISQLPKGDS